MAVDPWQLVRRGAVDQALKQIRQAYTREPDSSHIMELGVALLWVKDYPSALKHFNAANRERPRGVDGFYGMAGTAQWCLGRPDKAVAEWREGLACEFVDMAGGVELPLLLYHASVMEPSAFPRAEAMQLLEARAKDGRASIWPGPVAAYLLDWINENDLRRECEGDDDSDTAIQNWMAGFYLAVCDRDRGDDSRFAELMQGTSTTTDEDFDPKTPDFLTKLWHYELFLARHYVESGQAS